MPGVATAASPAGREVVHLSPGASLVPDALLEPPWRSDSRGSFRDLAALLLDRHLRRLVRIRQPIDLRLARLLDRLDSGSGYLALGFARLTDYATERLGLPSRRVQTLLALARRLGDLPQLAAAFEVGHVSLSQVQLLLLVVTPDTEVDWIARATTMTVRRLETLVRAAQRSAAVAECAAEAESGRETEHAAAVEGATEPARQAPPQQTLPALDDDPAVEGEFIAFAAPVRLRARWEQALELARRSSGASDPVWRSAEFIAAEYLSGVPDIALALSRSIAARGEAGAPAGAVGEGANGEGATRTEAAAAECDPCVTARAGESGPNDGTDLYEEVLAAVATDIESGSRQGSDLANASWPGDGPRIVLPDAVRDDPADSPRDLDARLLELIRMRQGVSWNLGRLLRIFADRRFHREFGLMSLSRYCRERLGLGVRRAWQLIALERRLFLLPATARAYKDGALSWVKASAIARVATQSTEARWLRLAESVSVRRLLEEVALSEAGLAPAGPAGLDIEGRVQLSAPLRAATQPSPAPPSREARGPEPQTRIRFWAPHEVASLWHEALALCRTGAGAPLTDAECVDAILDAFFATWSVRADAAWRRRYGIFERDGWRCRVPGCTSRRNLHVHHVTFRSHGGSDDDANLAVLCAVHHLQGIHRGRLRCHALPDGLLAWEFAPDPETGPLVAYVEDVLWAAARAAVASEARATVADAP